MPRRIYTVQNLVDEVKSQLDEENVESVSDSRDVLPSLNRGLDYAGNVLARRYPDPFVKHVELALTTDTVEYDLPEDCFEDRISKLEIEINGSFQEVRRISYYDIGAYESRLKAPIPFAYCITERKIRMVPGPNGVYNARIWYMRQPEELVLPQGRITVINTASNYVTVDSAGSDLSTESDTLESYVNIIDGQTGIVKWSGQIQLLDDNRIQFRSSPLRTSVLNRTIDGSLPVAPEEPLIELDDYVCSVRGICVPYFGQPLSNFLIQFAVQEITRKLGGEAQSEEQVGDKFEKQVATTWAGRENTMRIKRRSSAWGRPWRRWFPTNQ